MSNAPQDFTQRYAAMSKLELMELARGYDSLVEPAQTALRAEFSKRNLEPPLIGEPVEWDSRELITVRRYRDLSEAIVGRSLLESAGMEAWVRDENLIRLDWGYSNLIGGIRLQVDTRDEAAAIEVLSQPVPETIPFAEQDAYVQPTCPHCGSLEITFGGSSRAASLISLYALSIPVPSGDPTWICESCGAHWRDGKTVSD